MSVDSRVFLRLALPMSCVSSLLLFLKASQPLDRIEDCSQPFLEICTPEEFIELARFRLNFTARSSFARKIEDGLPQNSSDHRNLVRSHHQDAISFGEVSLVGRKDSAYKDHVRSFVRRPMLLRLLNKIVAPS